MLRGEAWIEEEWGPGIFVIRMVKVLRIETERLA
jgi:hypothetical protein